MGKKTTNTRSLRTTELTGLVDPIERSVDHHRNRVMPSENSKIMPSIIDGPRLIHPDEFREAMVLTERCFGYDPGGLEARMPHCFDDTKPERHAIIKQNGTVVSHVACIPAELRAGETLVDCHGIAGVATDPTYRGEGHMTQLLEFWLEHLDSREIPLAELEGDRMGYERFGWENAGREIRYRITDRSFTARTDGDDAVRPYRGEDDLDLIAGVHERERYRVVRDRRRYERLFDQHELETIVYEGSQPAYLSYRGRDPASILEFGGSREGLTALLTSVLQSASEIELFTHPHHPHVPFFSVCALDWETHPHRKLNLLDLPKTIRAYEPLLSERWLSVVDEFGPIAGSITLEIDGETTEIAETATIGYDGSSVCVERTSETPDVSLDRREMTQFLFGSSDVYHSTKRLHPFLMAVLPLEYYFWQTETI